MKQNLQSKNTIISFKKWEYELLLEFCHFLLTQRNLINHAKYFKKDSNIPKSNVYISTFIRNNYPYDNTNQVRLFYNMITNNVTNLSINHFYNTVNYLYNNNVKKLSLLAFFNTLELSKKLKNNLTEKNTINNNIEFLKRLNHDN